MFHTPWFLLVLFPFPTKIWPSKLSWDVLPAISSNQSTTLDDPLHQALGMSGQWNSNSPPHQTRSKHRCVEEQHRWSTGTWRKKSRTCVLQQTSKMFNKLFKTDNRKQHWPIWQLIYLGFRLVASCWNMFVPFWCSLLDFHCFFDPDPGKFICQVQWYQGTNHKSKHSKIPTRIDMRNAQRILSGSNIANRKQRTTLKQMHPCEPWQSPGTCLISYTTQTAFLFATP